MANVVCISQGPQTRGSAYRRALAAARATGGTLTIFTLPRRRSPAGQWATPAGGPPSAPAWRRADPEPVPSGLDDGEGWNVEAAIRPLPRTPWPEVLSEALPAAVSLVVKVAAAERGTAERDAEDLALLRRLPCSLWLVSALRYERPPGPVLAALALDEATEGLDRAVLRTAALVAGVEELPLCVTHSWALIGESIVTCPTRGIGPFRGRRVLRRIRKEHEQRLDALLGRTDIPADVPRVVVKGTVPVGIRRALRQTEASVLLVGYRGRTGLSRWIQPNLAEEFLGTPGLSLVAVRGNVQ
ncbi:MAG: hypothetical protein ACE5GJ_07445 [Gemmatimonadota bacterium]